MENIRIKHPKIAEIQADIDRKKKNVMGAPMRQSYHFMPDAGWINDPNGLIWFRGQYHAFFQYSPECSLRGSANWGHAVSDDLFHWKQLPIALIPDQPYDDWDNGGCYSGSAIEKDDRLYVMYTGATEGRQVQCIAWTDDGINFEKHPGNPVLEAPEGFSQADFRDPKVFRHRDSYYVVVGATRDNRGCALLFRSPDLFKWEFVNVLAESRGELGFMWECPDFFPVGDGKHALIFSPCGLGDCQTVYLVGEMDFDRGRLDHHTFGVIDWGMDFYAPQTFLDGRGRRLMIGWASAWEWMPYWQGQRTTASEGWCNGFNLPREVRLMPDNTLAFIPVDEVKSLRSDPVSISDAHIMPETPLDIGRCPIFEMELEIDLARTDAHRICLELRKAQDSSLKIVLDLASSQMMIDRNQVDEKGFGCSRSDLPLRGKDHLDLHIFVDTSSAEVFTNDHRICHSVNFYTPVSKDGIELSADGGSVHISKIIIYPLRRTVY